MKNRNIITIATGKKLYVDLAVNLARSFMWWHPSTDIRFYIVTDSPEFIPTDVQERIELIIVKSGDLGEGFSSKLFLDKLAPEGQTLFIDSDCLIFGDLGNVFERFAGRQVSVIGSHISEGEWFGDIAEICRKFKISKMPKFNGGIYYLEKGAIASKVYESAREIEKAYDEIGFVRLRNKPNDEVIMSLAMELNEQTPIQDDGSIMSDPFACPGKYFLNVITGERLLTNPPLPSPLHQNWYPFSEVRPLVVHFLGYFTQHYQYKREVFRLEKALKSQLNFQSELESRLRIELPERLTNLLKNTFRPLFHTFFKPRSVKKSERV